MKEAASCPGNGSSLNTIQEEFLQDALVLFYMIRYKAKTQGCCCGDCEQSTVTSAFLMLGTDCTQSNVTE